MKILSTLQIREADQSTIVNEPISSFELLQRAAQVFGQWYEERFGTEKAVNIFCGKGNNGGDGLMIADYLSAHGYTVEIFIIELFDHQSPEFKLALELVQSKNICPVHLISSDDDIPVFENDEILIDAILGSGLNKPIGGELVAIFKFINQLCNLVISVDVPSGLFSDTATYGEVIHADHSFSFEMPRLAFLLPDNFPYVGSFHFRSIGLDPTFIKNVPCSYFYVDETMAKTIFKVRPKFSHKGMFGHALLVMGSHGKLGAAILATKSCLKTGAGLVTVHVPSCGFQVMQQAIPEAMVTLDEDEFIVTKVYELQKYNAVAVGCGLSTKNKTRNALCYILKNMNNPTVLDADALNILAQSPDWMEYIPKNSILTPHPKEFERMFGKTNNSFDRFHLLREKAMELDVFIILKGANSCIATPDGNCYFNSTGNPGMGTAGSGDVLTGILAGLLAQEYSPLESCILGVYLHGLAGDFAAEAKSQESLMAGDISEYLGEAYKTLYPTDMKTHRQNQRFAFKNYA